MPVKELVEFILYVTPGFLALYVYRSFYPVKRQSEFNQIAISVVYGVCIFALVSWLDESYFNEDITNIDSEGFPQPYFIIVLFVSGILWGGILVLNHFLRIRISQKYECLRFIAPDPQSIWFKVNQPYNKDWSVVFLNDGSIYLGYISTYKFDPDLEDQDFLLSKAKLVDSDLSEIYSVNGIGVYMNTRDVKRIEFVKSSNK